jgi:hypothetical protein
LGTNFGTNLRAIQVEDRLLWQVAVEPSMGNLVDSLRVGVARVMSDAECEKAESEPLAVADEAEDIPNLPFGAGK